MANARLTGELQSRRREKAVKALSSYRQDRTAVAEVLAKVFQPVSVWYQGWRGFDDHQILGAPAWGNL